VAQAIPTGHKRDKTVASTRNSETALSHPIVYQIRIQGHLGAHWSDWFAGLTITTLDNGDTLLTGPVVDQAALYGVLRSVRDVGLPLVSVNPVPPGQAEASEIRQ